MKKILVFFITAVLTIALSLPVCAREATKIPLKVGYINNYGMINMPVILGELGYFYEYVNKINEFYDYKYEIDFVECSHENVFEKLENGEIDIYGPVVRSDELLDRVVYTESCYDYAEILIVGSHNNHISYNDVKALDGSVIAVNDSCISDKLLNDFLERNSISPTIVEQKNDSVSKGIEAGEYDYAVLTSMHTQAGVIPVASIGSEELCFVAREDNLKIISEFDVAIENFYVNQHTYRYDLYYKYYANAVHTSELISAKELQLLQEKKIYTVGFDSDYSPISYYDKNGVPKGIIIDIMNLIADEVGIILEYYPIDKLSDEDIADANFDFNLSVFEEATSLMSAGELVPSEIYLRLPLMFLQKIDSNGVSKIGSVTYYSVDNNSVINHFGTNKFTFYETYEELNDAIVAGDVSSALISYVASNLLNEEINLDEYYLTPLNFHLNYAILFPDEFDPLKITAINKVINSLDKSTVEIILMKNFAKSPRDITFLKAVKSLKGEITCAVAIMLVIFCAYIIISNRLKKIKMLKRLNIDSLTGFFTQHRFIKEVESALIDDSSSSTYIILSIDIDNFKYLNESYGYERGSSILIGFSDLIAKSFVEARAFARHSGDIFLVLIESEVLGENIDFKYLIDEFYDCLYLYPYNFSVSIGAFEILQKDDDINFMIDCANVARRLGKSEYTNTVNFFTNEMRIATRRTNAIVSRMEDAMVNKEFFIEYQPIVDLKTEQVIGAEALVRWLPPNEDVIYPEEFISIFEKNAFIINLDFYVIDSVFSFVYQANAEDIKISINLSELTILRNDLISKILQIEEKYNLKRESIEFEIKANTICRNKKRVFEVADGLRRLGYAVSIDEFGSENSSLESLQHIIADAIKFSREFTATSFDDKKGVMIVETVIGMAKNMSLQTVAVGVKTEKEAWLLNELGCDFAQGYYYYSPLSKDDFTEIIKNR